MNLRIKNRSAEKDLKIERHLSEFILIWRALQIDLDSDKLGYEIKALNLTRFLSLCQKKKLLRQRNYLIAFCLQCSLPASH